jgi:1,4-dihydroxy-2-naphthoate octaprenyltransferase
LRAWIVGIRPASLSASMVPVLVGTAAGRPHHLERPLAFVSALLASMLIQIGTNFANDAFDFQSGADTAERLGPRRLVLSGAVSPRGALVGAMIAFGIAALLGLYLIAVGGWPILIIGLLSIVSGLAYTGGPWPLGYHGLGDVFTFIFFGVLGVTGSAYLQTLHFSWTALLASLPVGFLITAILVVNNLRDIETDRTVGKRTLAVRIGEWRTRRQYHLLVLSSYVVPPIIWAATGRAPLFLLTWLTLPLAISAIRTVSYARGPALNLMLKRTGQLNLLFGVLFAIALWL